MPRMHEYITNNCLFDRGSRVRITHYYCFSIGFQQGKIWFFILSLLLVTHSITSLVKEN